ncbi:MAG: hypothetical protein JWP89_1197 [Schlesneria sp.]|nr:hypothetical protein [Schlesneria sp.]
MATHIIPGTTSMVFGEGGGLYEVMFAGTGFLHVRREVYMRVLEHHQLPICYEHFNSPTIPFFHPILLPTDDGTWYLAEEIPAPAQPSSRTRAECIGGGWRPNSEAIVASRFG